MDIVELDDIERSVDDLLSLAKIELEEKRLQQQRSQQVEAKTAELRERLVPLIEKVDQMVANFEADDLSDSIMRGKLQAKADDLRFMLDNAENMAIQYIDQQLIQTEEALLDERMTEQTNHWRMALKDDLLEMIAEQQDFYSATDAAIAVRGFLHDLKAIDALDDVVQALIDQINSNSEEGPVARLRGSYEQTLAFIYNKALENRARVDYSPNIQPRTRHRTTDKRPNPYTELEGKVVVFGGHDRLEAGTRTRLRDSNVELVWCTAQSGPQIAEQAEAHIATADLIFVVTGYTSHKLTTKATQAAQRSNKTIQMINTTGLIRILEAIEFGLKSKQWAEQINHTTGIARL